MTVNLKLGPVELRDPMTDPMARSWVGWSPTSTPAEIFENNRGVWCLGRRALFETFVTLSFSGTVKIVGRIDRLERIAGPGPARTGFAIVGEVLTPGDPSFDKRFGRRVDTHRNPVTYVDDEERRCVCGCQAPVTAPRVFLAGHDKRAVYSRVVEYWGGTVAFLKWVDESPDLQLRVARGALEQPPA